MDEFFYDLLSGKMEYEALWKLVKNSEYDQELPQSQMQTNPWHRETVCHGVISGTSCS